MHNFKAPTNNTLDDFWRLIWQEHPPTIVIVTNLVEREKVCMYVHRYHVYSCLSHESVRQNV